MRQDKGEKGNKITKEGNEKGGVCPAHRGQPQVTPSSMSTFPSSFSPSQFTLHYQGTSHHSSLRFPALLCSHHRRESSPARSPQQTPEPQVAGDRARGSVLAGHVSYLFLYSQPWFNKPLKTRRFSRLPTKPGWLSLVGRLVFAKNQACVLQQYQFLMKTTQFCGKPLGFQHYSKPRGLWFFEPCSQPHSPSFWLSNEGTQASRSALHLGLGNTLKAIYSQLVTRHNSQSEPINSHLGSN